MEKVYVYKNSSGEYRVHPAVVVLGGGDKVRIVNATGVTLTVPAGASKPNDPVEVDIPAEKHEDIMSRSQGFGKTRAYSYTVATASGKKARGNSDPILIIEN